MQEQLWGGGGAGKSGGLILMMLQLLWISASFPTFLPFICLVSSLYLLNPPLGPGFSLQVASFSENRFQF